MASNPHLDVGAFVGAAGLPEQAPPHHIGLQGRRVKQHGWAKQFTQAPMPPLRQTNGLYCTAMPAQPTVSVVCKVTSEYRP